MQFCILAALFTVALASEIYPQAKNQAVPAYPQPQYHQQSYRTNEKTEDYSPKPYSFDYAVKDDYTYADFSHNEYSDGKAVSGAYRVVLPDSRVQTVTYKDEGYGLIADVKYEGTAQYQESNKPAYKPAYSAAYDQATPANNQPKPVSEQPKLAYEQSQVSYESSKYPVQSNQRPVYNPAPVPFNSAPVAYKPEPAVYQTSPVAYNSELASFKASQAQYNPVAVSYKPAPQPSPVAYKPAQVAYSAAPVHYKPSSPVAYHPTPATYSKAVPYSAATEYATNIKY